MNDPLIGPWFLKNINDFSLKNNHLNVFSCFHGGGGSSMGYKLAGFNVIGGCEIDKDMMSLYRKNLNPNSELSFQMPIQELYNKNLNALNNIDILDGSPPCSSFSMAGSREDDWGKIKKFREGQSLQKLDDLFFNFLDIAELIKPKIIVAENVKGLILGKARGYVKQIFKKLNAVGYESQLFLLNSENMGVPQKRERTFFICRRKDLNLPKLLLSFSEKKISLQEALVGCMKNGRALPPSLLLDWNKIKCGASKRYFSSTIANPLKPCSTLTSKATSAAGGVMHWDSPRKFSRDEVVRIQSFPDDYDFIDHEPGYVCGMSVPPFMMMRVAREIHRQLFT